MSPNNPRISRASPSRPAQSPALGSDAGSCTMTSGWNDGGILHIRLHERQLDPEHVVEQRHQMRIVLGFSHSARSWSPHRISGCVNGVIRGSLPNSDRSGDFATARRYAAGHERDPRRKGRGPCDPTPLADDWRIGGGSWRDHRRRIAVAELGRQARRSEPEGSRSQQGEGGRNPARSTRNRERRRPADRAE